MAAPAQKHEDTERLGMALEYFTAGKYHESLLLFQKLDKSYRLNDRFKAYIGLCYYHEWDFEKAAEYLDKVLPNLSALSPQERNVYYYADAESHFNMGDYENAIPLYEESLVLCKPAERADALYRLGFCYMFREDWGTAHEYFSSSLAYYESYRNVPDIEARRKQIIHMVDGCEKEIEKTKGEK